MVGMFSEFGIYFLWAVAIVAFGAFGVPLLFFPIQYGRFLGWKVPEEQTMLLYYGRAFGVTICVIAILTLKAMQDPNWTVFFFHQIFWLFLGMMSVHIFTAVKGLGTKIINGEIVFWAVLALASLMLGPKPA